MKLQFFVVVVTYVIVCMIVIVTELETIKANKRNQSYGKIHGHFSSLFIEGFDES